MYMNIKIEGNIDDFLGNADEFLALDFIQHLEEQLKADLHIQLIKKYMDWKIKVYSQQKQELTK